MTKKLFVVPAFVILLAPALAFAHAGHEHGEPAPAVVEAPKPAAADPAQTRLLQENVALKKELEKERLNSARIMAEKSADNSATRSSFLITGLLLGVVGLVIRYLPGGKEK
ncbi:MAG: hypothetical protein HY280_01365 [Nitrospinae bacterium]|nr:hypothetical protein [Nitrospinota bacterium]